MSAVDFSECLKPQNVIAPAAGIAFLVFLLCLYRADLLYRSVHEAYAKALLQALQVKYKWKRVRSSRLNAHKALHCMEGVKEVAR